MKSNTTHSPINETFELPSNGLLYGGTIPKDITLRCMTTFEEKMRLGSGSFAKSMTMILDSCIINEDKNFTSGDLTDTDFWYLLYKLRVITYGPDYNVQTQCSNCSKMINTTVNLDDLKVMSLSPEDAEPRVITLPYSKDEIGLRYLRASEVDEMAAEADRIMSKSPDYYGDPSYLIEMEHKIATVNGKELSSVDKKNYVNSMIGRDSAYFHQKSDESTHGLITAVEIVCPHCNETHKFGLPLTSEFFRPVYRD